METSLLFTTVPIILALLSSIVALGADRYPLLLRAVAFILLGLSGITAILLGGDVLLIEDKPLTAQLSFGLTWMDWNVRLDPLSGFFLIIIGIITTAVSLYGPGYVREFEHGPYSLSVLGVFTGLLVAGMQLVLLADDAFMFMVAWEIMSLAGYFLVAYQHLQAVNRRAAFLYLLMAHVGALSILLSLSILVNFAGDFTFAAMRQPHLELPLMWASLAFGLGLFGFGMKAGLVPLHAWLPETYSVTPSHVTTLMSGAMLKVGIYGLIRLVFDLLGTHLDWRWGIILLFVGSGSAFLGILYALVQNDLKRLLAYSSIENAGIICIGLGLSMLFMAKGHPQIAVLAMIAALYHTLNHALFKGLLFLGAGAIAHTSHEQNLEQMGGLIHRLPYTAFFFLIGCLSISALPPFNGFVSEWLTFQAALQAPKFESGVLRAMIPISAALLALTAALSAACFVKAFGTAFLGQARSRHVRHGRETDFGMRAAQGLLASLCFLFGIFPTTVIGVLEKVPQQLLGQGLPSASAEGWIWLTPIDAKVASYSAPLVLLSILAVWVTVYLVIRRTKNIRHAYPWDCGFGALNARMQYTATAFAMPIRRIFKTVWQIDEQINEVKDETLYSRDLRYHLQITDRSWPVLYEPLTYGLTWVARHIGYIQTGHIRTYLAYSFFTLLVLLWLIT